MEAQPIDHPMLAEKTSVEDILSDVSVHRETVEISATAGSTDGANLLGDLFHSGSDFGGTPDNWHSRSELPFQDPLISAVSEEQDFLDFTARELEDQAAMLKMVQERGSTSSWNGDLSAGVKIVAAADPSDGR